MSQVQRNRAHEVLDYLLDGLEQCYIDELQLYVTRQWVDVTTMEDARPHYLDAGWTIQSCTVPSVKYHVGGE